MPVPSIGGYYQDGILTPNLTQVSAIWGDAGNTTVGAPLYYDANSVNEVGIPTQANINSFAGVAQYVSSDLVSLAVPDNTGGETTVYVTETVSAGDIVFPIIGTAGYQKTVKGMIGKGAARIITARTGAGTTNAQLLDGPPGVSAAVESITVDGAETISQFGTTYVGTSSSATSSVLAAGAFVGQRKRFTCGTVATQPTFDGTFSTPVFGGAGAYTGLELADLAEVIVEWDGVAWAVVANNGGTFS